MDWSDLKSVIGNIAPVLGTVIGGPAGTAIGALISSALGTDNTPPAVAAAIATDPQAALKLQQLEISHAEYLAGLQAQSQAAQVGLDETAEQKGDVLGRWRDGAGWIAVAGLAWGTIGANLLQWILAISGVHVTGPVFDTGSLISLLVSMLGLGALHMTENLKGAYHV